MLLAPLFNRILHSSGRGIQKFFSFLMDGDFMETECIFCKIIRHEMPATILFEDDRVIAIDDIHPKAPIHKLIIPKRHIPTLNDLTQADNDLMGHIFQVAKQLAAHLAIAEPGYRVIMNCNRAGGQVIYHIHLHLLGGRQMPW